MTPRLRFLAACALLTGSAAFGAGYEPARYDLSALPAYAPAQRVTGVLRVYGTPLEELVGKWATAFRKYHGQVRLNAYLINTSQAFAGLVTGSADIGLMGHRQWRNGFQAFEAQFGYAPLEIRFASGSYDFQRPTTHHPTTAIAEGRCKTFGLARSTWTGSRSTQFPRRIRSARLSPSQ